MPKSTAKRRQTPPKKRPLYTPEPVRGRVIARHIGGQSNRRIASEEKIDRDTVSRILSQQEVAQMIAQYQAQLLGMVPKAIGVYDEALACDDLRIAAAAATKLLEGFHVLPKDGIEQCPLEPDPDQRKHLLLGQMMEMMLCKKERYGIPLPPEFDAVENQLTKGLEGPSGDSGEAER